MITKRTYFQSTRRAAAGFTAVLLGMLAVLAGTGTLAGATADVATGQSRPVTCVGYNGYYNGKKCPTTTTGYPTTTTTEEETTTTEEETTTTTEDPTTTTEGETTTTEDPTTTTEESPTTSDDVEGTIVTRGSTDATVAGRQIARALPATGSSSLPMTGVGVVLVGVGLAFLASSRLQRHRVDG